MSPKVNLAQEPSQSKTKVVVAGRGRSLLKQLTHDATISDTLWSSSIFPGFPRVKLSFRKTSGVFSTKGRSTFFLLTRFSFQWNLETNITVPYQFQSWPNSSIKRILIQNPFPFIMDRQHKTCTILIESVEGKKLSKETRAGENRIFIAKLDNICEYTSDIFLTLLETSSQIEPNINISTWNSWNIG